MPAELPSGVWGTPPAADSPLAEPASTAALPSSARPAQSQPARLIAHDPVEVIQLKPSQPIVTDLPETAEPTVVVKLPQANASGMRDSPATRLRYPADLLGVIGCAFAMVVVCLLVVYAGNTTQGLTEDVQTVAYRWLQRILTGPVTALRTVLVLFAPIAVSLTLILRRQTAVLLMSLAAALGGLVLNTLVYIALNAWAPDALFHGLALGSPRALTLPSYAAAMIGLLISAARPARRRSLTAAWTLLWVTVGVDILTNKVTLGGMGLSLLAGCLAGLGARYCFGVPSERAYGQSLIDGLRQVGYEPASLDRAGLAPTSAAVVAPPGGLPGAGRWERVQTPQFFADHRLYALKTTNGREFDVVVLDGDRQVVGVLTRWWRQLRSRGIDPRRVTSLRQSAERAALLSYSVRAVGVRTPAVLAMVEVDDSMLLVREPVPPSQALADLPEAELTDRRLQQMWRELGRAHQAGITHRALTDQVFRLGEPGLNSVRDVALPAVPEPGADDRADPVGPWWMLGWEAGDVASSDLARHIDQAQLVALIGLKIGPQRAVEAAAAALPEEDLRLVGSLLQSPAMPARTREQLRAQPDLLGQLRQTVAQRFPQAELEPQKLARVSVRAVVSALLTAVALFVVLTSLNLDQVATALRASRWYWALASFGFGLVAVAGAAVLLVAFSPVRLGFFTAWVSQLAAGYVAVSVPAGIGTTGLNLRFLQKKGVAGTLATATAALIQVSQVVITVLTLLVLTLATGSATATSFRVSPTILIVVAALAGAIGVVFAVPQSRTWVLARIMPTLRQTWPRLVELVSNPGRLLLGLAGNLVVLGGYVLAFQAALWAFGADLPLVPSAMAYLIGNSAGSVAPTPGGMGAIEAAELAALGAAGINPGVAASVVVVFRLATFWIRIPLGWVAYRALEKRGDL